MKNYTIKPMSNRHLKHKKQLLFLTLIILFFTLRFFISGDGSIRFFSLVDLIFKEHHQKSLAVSLIGPLFSLPLWLPGILLNAKPLIISLVSRYNFFLFILGLMIFHRSLKSYLPPNVLANFLLILIAASIFPAHLKNYYGEVFTTLTVGGGIILINTKKEFLGWLMVILGVTNTPAAFLGLLLVALYKLFSTKKIRYLGVIILTALSILLETTIRTGNPFSSKFGYGNILIPYTTSIPFTEKTGFQFPFIIGLISILFSFGTGLIFFLPAIFIPVNHELKLFKPQISHIYHMWLLFLLGLIIVYAKWYAWHGGWFWGPRFFLFGALPASLILAIRLSTQKTSIINKLITISLLCYSTFLAINSAIIEPLNFCREKMDNLPLCWYVPQYNILINPFINNPTFVVGDYLIIGISLLVLAVLIFPIVKELFKDLNNHYKKPLLTYVKFNSWHL